MHVSKNLAIIAITFVISFGLGTLISNLGAPDPSSNFRVAVVDIQKISSNSEQINSINFDRTKKLNSLQKAIDNAESEVISEKNILKQKALETGYNQELLGRKNSIDKEYVKKMSGVEIKMNSIINKIAQKKHYNLVLDKNSVISGGINITDEVIKELK